MILARQQFLFFFIATTINRFGFSLSITILPNKRVIINSNQCCDMVLSLYLFSGSLLNCFNSIFDLSLFSNGYSDDLFSFQALTNFNLFIVKGVIFMVDGIAVFAARKTNLTAVTTTVYISPFALFNDSMNFNEVAFQALHTQSVRFFSFFVMSKEMQNTFSKKKTQFLLVSCKKQF